MDECGLCSEQSNTERARSSRWARCVRLLAVARLPGMAKKIDWMGLRPLIRIHHQRMRAVTLCRAPPAASCRSGAIGAAKVAAASIAPPSNKAFWELRRYTIVTFLQHVIFYDRLNRVRPIYDTPTAKASTLGMPAEQDFIVSARGEHGGCHEKRYCDA
jgi:hypothetical protein